MHGEGAYTHNQKEIIYCIVKTRELPKLKDIIIEIDPKAFMSVSDTKEVLGKGFYQEGFK
ncbi:MAG: YitT family protein [bacterium]